MKFIKELAQQLDPTWWSRQAVVCFTGPLYPLLFLSAWQQKLKNIVAKPYVICDLTTQDLSSLKSSLGTSFLGESCIYYLGDISSLPTKKRDAWDLYISQYKGPHCLVFFSDKLKQVQKNDKAHIIEVSEWLNQQEHIELLKLYWTPQEFTRCRPFVMQLFKQYGRILVDEGYLLSHYAILLGANTQQFMSSWVETIVPNEGSLFEMSAALLAGKKEAFIEQHSLLKDVYPLPFWVSFWSEQLFRAHYYCQYKKDNRLQEAKQIGFRLPFSFLQKDWRSSSIKSFKNGHKLLYQIDYDFKNGSSELQLDNFYFQML